MVVDPHTCQPPGDGTIWAAAAASAGAARWEPDGLLSGEASLIPAPARPADDTTNNESPLVRGLIAQAVHDSKRGHTAAQLLERAVILSIMC